MPFAVNSVKLKDDFTQFGTISSRFKLQMKYLVSAVKASLSPARLVRVTWQ